MKFEDPNSPMLMDRTGTQRVATTDPRLGTIFLSTELEGSFLLRVLIHELGHCALFSYGLLEHIHRMVHPYYWIEAEEWVCNFMADYGRTLHRIAYDILDGKEA